MRSRFLRFLPILYVISLLPGCYPRQAFYVSPFNGNTSDYHVEPLLRDSARSAIYVDGAYFGGGANDDRIDHFKGGSVSVYRSHHGRYLQGYYGLTLAMGNFKQGKWDSSMNSGIVRPSDLPRNADLLNALRRDRFFGGTGFDGGLNFVLPMGVNGGEWRIAGFETSVRREFGDYLAFRQKLPDSLATVIGRHRLFATMGVTTEFVGRVGDGDLGFKISHGWVLGGDYNYLGLQNNATSNPLRFIYTGVTIHFTKGRYSGSLQTVFATQATSGRLGLSYRLSKPRLHETGILR